MININLFPIEEIKRKYQIKVTIIGNVIGLLIVILLFGTFFYMNSEKIKHIDAEIAYNKHKLNELKALRRQLKKFQKDKKILQTKFKIIKELESCKKMPSYMMYLFSENIPEKLWLKNYSEKGTSVKLSAITIDEPTIVQFISMLRKSKSFSKIELIQVNQIIISGYKFKSFSMSLEIDKNKLKSKL